MTHVRNFGVQSYCLREVNRNEDVADKVLEMGLSSIEICGVHADFNNLEEWRKIVGIYTEKGVSISSLGVQTFIGEEREREWFECARVAGAKHISAHFRVDSFHQAIPKVKQWCEEFGIRVGLHCHGGYKFGGSPDVIDHLLDIGGPYIGLCLDTAWAMQIGPTHGNPLDWVARYAGRIYGVHYKDFVFDKRAMWSDVVVGRGNLPLKRFVDALEKTGFDGMAVIEYEADPDNPVPALKACVRSMREAIGQEDISLI
ncbi:MAG: sugar phosphate isomerase/epimerase [Saprospiraceae bacterium]|nr:sugar phosphate isomerase/epimerase [Saprospiraceae bacterium]